MNWIAVVVVAVVATAAFMGGYALYTRAALSRPLGDYYLSHPAVSDVEIDVESGTWVIQLKVEPVERWSEAYRDLWKESQRLLGDRPFRMEMTDGRSPELEEAFRSLHFVIYETLATGRFSLLAGLMEQDLPYRLAVEIDSQRLYVQMEMDGSYLYEVIERPTGEVQTPD